MSESTGTQSLQRAVALLRVIMTRNRTGSRLVDLYRRVGLERATAHRILQGLVAEKLVRQDPISKRYYLGTMLYEMGLAAAPRLALRDICQPHIRQVAEQTGDTVFMTVRSGLDGVCIAREDGSYPIKVFAHDVGRHRPLNVGAGGMAILSALPDDEVGRLCLANIERTRRKNPGYTAATLRAAVAATRRLGYSLNKVPDLPEVLSVGMAIRDPRGAPVGAISVMTLASRLAGERLKVVLGCIGDAIASIEAELAQQIGAADVAETPDDQS